MDTQTPNENTSGKNVFLIINQQITPLTKDVTRLGRQLDNDIVFKEEAVSRHHAEIRCEQGKYILNDLLSTSGTFVNSRRIERCVLNSGDLISLANIQFMFVNNNPRITNASVGQTRNLTPDDGEKADGK
ncbi:MAG TPA: FHA domain-containing protein [Anaerolineales bacterium]|nr:FHA domain-containing protein [Anaerolineales bacterium]